MVSAPYMHDGRIADIDAVIEHYNSQVQDSPSLDTLLNKPGQPLGIPLSTTEKAALKAFFATLTDLAFLAQ
jgi:cytochrome c peroxidase